jgi:hypothetical protein
MLSFVMLVIFMISTGILAVFMLGVFLMSLIMSNAVILSVIMLNAVASYFQLKMEQHTLKKCKQLFEYQHLLLLRDIWWSKF